MSLNGRQKLAAEKSLRPNVPNEIDHFALGDSFAHIRPRRRHASAGVQAYRRARSRRGCSNREERVFSL